MPAEILTDFGNAENRRAYLLSKFDDLLQGINNIYGKELMEELIRRLEKTVVQFHQDVQELINQIKLSKTAGKNQSDAAFFSDSREAANKNRQVSSSEVSNPPQT